MGPTPKMRGKATATLARFAAPVDHMGVRVSPAPRSVPFASTPRPSRGRVSTIARR